MRRFAACFFLGSPAAPRVRAFDSLPNGLDLQTCLGGGSLSAACEALLGAPLDKRMQCSDWLARPLSDDQRTYAAMDAHVLTLLYDARTPLPLEPPPPPPPPPPSM